MDKDRLNNMVIDLFHGISYEEEKAVITDEFKDISKIGRASCRERVVYISLSEKGRKAYSHHREFHKRMIQGLLDTLNEQEQDLLVKVMQYFHDYFREHM